VLTKASEQVYSKLTSHKWNVAMRIKKEQDVGANMLTNRENHEKNESSQQW